MRLQTVVLIMAIGEVVSGLLAIAFLVLIAQFSGLIEFGLYALALGFMLGKSWLHDKLSQKVGKISVPIYLAVIPTMGLIAGLAAGYALTPDPLKATILQSLAQDTLWIVLLALLYGLLSYTGLWPTLKSMVSPRR